jgi:hypothetical protein
MFRRTDQLVLPCLADRHGDFFVVEGASKVEEALTSFCKQFQVSPGSRFRTFPARSGCT